jgi:hypothetical protein
VVKDVLKVVRQHIQVGNAVGPTLPVVCPGCSREGNFAGQGPDIYCKCWTPEESTPPQFGLAAGFAQTHHAPHMSSWSIKTRVAL